jgi:hypothetical protein
VDFFHLEGSSNKETKFEHVSEKECRCSKSSSVVVHGFAWLYTGIRTIQSYFL